MFNKGDVITIHDFKQFLIDNPYLRVGQAFSILFIKDDSHPIYHRLWELDHEEAWYKIYEIMEYLQWKNYSLQVIKDIE